jgi:hypothetical protein
MKAATFSAAAQNPEYSSPIYFSADDLLYAADHHLAGGINSVHLEDRLRDVETDRRDRLHD